MSDRPVEFWGRLYQGKAQRDPKNMDFSVADLMAMANLKGTPVWNEHNAKQGIIGEILHSWVDARDKWLWIHGRLHGPDKIGEEMFSELREKLVSGQIPDLSLHWVAQADAQTEVVDPSTRAIIEVSLTKEGLFDGTNLLSVAAHADSKTKTLHVALPGNRLSLQPPHKKITMSQDLQSVIADIQKRTGQTLTPEEVRLIAPDGTGLDGALMILNKLTDFAEKKDQEMGVKEVEIMTRSRLQEEEKAELEKLRGWHENAEKAYAEDQGKIAEEMYTVIEKRIPEKHRDSVKERLQAASSRSDFEGFWELVKLFGQEAAESGKLAKDYSKQIVRGKQDYNKLLQEKDAMTQQHTTREVEVAASSFSAKRGIDKDAVSAAAKKQKDESAGTKPVELMASREAAQANYFFGNSIGFSGEQDEFNSTLDKLVSQTKLEPGLPVMNWNHYHGFSKAPTYNEHGIMPFGTR